MIRVRVADGTVINAERVELVNGALNIVTKDHTVEELAGVFGNSENTGLITFLTESGAESGFKTGFTSFSGITYDAEGCKTVELFQPVDLTERKVATAMGIATRASEDVKASKESINGLDRTLNTLLGV